MNNKSEVIIIGSGIIGNSIAYYLAKAGKEVLVLEGSKNIAEGGSVRNGGGVRQSGRDVRELPLMMYGVKNIWPTLSQELGVDCEYHQDGNLRLGKTPQHMEILKGLTAKAVGVGLDVKMIDGEEVKALNPFLSDEVIGASYCATDGHANPLTTTLGFYKEARKNGARFISGEKVVELKKVRGVVKKVITENGNEYEGETIVLAAGIGSRKIAETVGLDIPVNKIMAETIVTEAEPHMFDQMLGTAMADFYGHQTKHGSFVFGGFSGFEGYRNNIPEETLSSYSITAPCVCRSILGYFPMLADTKVVRAWTGIIDECVDKVPVLGKVEEAPGLVLACAFSGHGFGIGPAAGNQIAQLILEGKTDVDLHELRYERFKAKG